MNSHKTAMKRLAPSAPMKRLASDGRIVGNALDYGCGHGYDAREYCMKRFDPHYYPDMPGGSFDTITCNYVLNTIQGIDPIVQVLWDIQDRLKPSGTAYITVRNDRRALVGITGKGTWQCLVVLKLPVVYKCAGYVTYELRADDVVNDGIVDTRTYPNGA